MSTIADDFAAALSTVTRPSAFFAAGTQQMLAPGLSVEGIGPVALPLLPMQAEQLIAAAERAPYGRGEETVTDIAVRRTWQIGADRVRVAGKSWPETIKAIVARVAETLGVDGAIEAELYKLLIYDRGSFFVPHRDTEKVAGMFGTLVLALPSVICEGGDLIVRHRDREERLELRCEEASDVAFAAFYADCVHEVLPVTEGFRLVLVYNLVRRGKGQPPGPPDYRDQLEALVAVLRTWAEEPRAAEDIPSNLGPDPDADDEWDDDEEDEDWDEDEDEVLDDPDEAADAERDDRGPPDKLIYTLEHAYTPAELGFGSLKGADAGIAPVVVAAAERAGCDVHLALVTIEESGAAQHNGNYRRGRYHDDDEADEDEFEVLEIGDRSAVASEWRRPDGGASPLMPIPVLEHEFSPPMSFEDIEPDEQHFHEATGNEGASFERSYRRAALILWPRDRILPVIVRAGLPVTLPFLEDLAERWRSGGDPSVLAEARALSRLMAARWRMDRWYRARDEGRTDVGRYLDVLRGLDDAAGIEGFLTALAGRHGIDAGDSQAIADALLVLPAERAATLATRLVEGGAEAALAGCANLLVRLSESAPAVGTGAARALVAALPGDRRGGSPVPAWAGGSGMRPELIVDLFTALGRIDRTLALVSADHVLDWPATYDFDAVLIPAVGQLLGSPETAGVAAVQRLREACVGFLDARIGLPLEAPKDWRRDDTLGCSCKDCQALGAFLRNAAEKVWVFAAAEARRRHVEATIQRARCDVNTATEKRGSPHKLICTKNQASYERRRAQRPKDLKERERLTG